MQSHSESYREAGVDVTAGYRAVELMKKHVSRTTTKGVLSGIGGFGGLFLPDLADMKEPVLVSGTDGVGTKLKIAFAMNKHDTIGIDCVAMCVNDIVCSGAAPMFFLDYLALGKNIPEQVAQIVSGVADGCEMAGCALIGGETAEMPGFYEAGEYDLAGFSVGIVDREKIIDYAAIRDGDAIIGIASSGIHSNGFSLVRKALDTDRRGVGEYIHELGATLGEALLTPTRIYVKPVLKLLQSVRAGGICHITGGGFYENIPRAIPQGFGAKIERKAIDVPPLFQLVQKSGEIPERDMFNTFNMGVGMCVIVRQDEADTAVGILRNCGERACVIGTIKKGIEGVEII